MLGVPKDVLAQRPTINFSVTTVLQKVDINMTNLNGFADLAQLGALIASIFLQAQDVLLLVWPTINSTNRLSSATRWLLYSVLPAFTLGLTTLPILMAV